MKPTNEHQLFVQMLAMRDTLKNEEDDFEFAMVMEVMRENEIETTASEMEKLRKQ